VVFERVEEAPLAIQRALARSLGSNWFERGSIRLLATTRRDLAVEVLEGRFFADLYFRLRVQVVEIPPLRERREDIPVIARSMLEEITKTKGGDPPELTSETLELATQYRWPGNVRQLRNELLRCAARAQHTIGRQLFAEGLDDRIPTQSVRTQQYPMSLRMRVGVYELQIIEEMLRSTNGNRERTASLLGVTRRTLQRKLAAARRLGHAVLQAPSPGRPTKLEKSQDASTNTTPPARAVELVREPPTSAP
jgi:DNA-binding NtrC family response regulator